VNNNHFSCAGHTIAGAGARSACGGRARDQGKHEVVRKRNGHFNGTTVVISGRRLRSDSCAAYCRSAFRTSGLTTHSASGNYHFREVDARRSYSLNVGANTVQICGSGYTRGGVRCLAAVHCFVFVATVAPHCRVPSAFFGSVVDVMVDKEGVAKPADPKKHTHEQNEDECVFN